MAYATQAQIELAAGGPARLKQIADWDADGNVDPTAIAWAQFTADALINAHTARRFADLVDDVGAVLDWAATMAANEAVYQLRRNRGQASDADERDALARLESYKAIALGDQVPGEPLPATSTQAASGWRARDASGASVSRAGLAGAGAVDDEAL